MGEKKQRQKGGFRVFERITHEALAEKTAYVVVEPVEFSSTEEALKWIKDNYDTCYGKNLMIIQVKKKGISISKRVEEKVKIDFA